MNYRGEAVHFLIQNINLAIQSKKQYLASMHTVARDMRMPVILELVGTLGNPGISLPGNAFMEIPNSGFKPGDQLAITSRSGNRGFYRNGAQQPYQEGDFIPLPELSGTSW
jgi:hypothetical protein